MLTIFYSNFKTLKKCGVSTINSDTQVMKIKLFQPLTAFAVMTFALEGCLAPVFSELQSARTVGKNNFELTPSYSTVSYTEDNETDGVQNHIGIQAAYGVSQKTDLRMRYEYLWPKDSEDGDGISVIGIGPKFSILENKFAFYLPIGRALGEDTGDTWQMHPTLLFTIPAAKDIFDITLAPKYLITFCEECDDLVAINLGLALGTDLNKWAVRPEFGLLFNPGESGYLTHFSLGFSFNLGIKSSANHMNGR